MPGSGPTPGQQAVLASAAHRPTETEVAQQKAFMAAYMQSPAGMARRAQ